MRIWVDADACPGEIKELLFRAAKRTKTKVTLVANQPMRTPHSEFIDSVFGPVWTTLYILMAIAAWLVWRPAGFKAAAFPLSLFGAQLLHSDGSSLARNPTSTAPAGRRVLNTCS